MDIYVISLQSTPERLESFKRENANIIDYKVLHAVEGQAYPMESFYRANVFEREEKWWPGATGCLLSHMCLWQRAAQGDHTVTICEDDALFHHHFPEHYERLTGALGDGFDLVMWGWNLDSCLVIRMPPMPGEIFVEGRQESMRDQYQRYRQESVNPSLYRLNRAFGTIAYSISPSCARWLMQNLFPISERTAYYPELERWLHISGVDRLLSTVYPQLNSWVSITPMVITLNWREDSTTIPAEEKPLWRSPHAT